MTPTPKSANPQTAKSAAPQLKMERVFNATPERLWDYWTDPKLYAKWMNPGKADLKIQKFEVRVGGEVAFLMPLDNGQEMLNTGVFHRLDRPNRILTGAPDRSFLIDVTFTPVDAKRTRMTIVVDGVPAEHHEMAKVGWGKGLDKLALHLSAPSASPTRTHGAHHDVKGLSAPAKGHVTKDRYVELERWFKASPEAVFKAWSDPRLLPKFFWPVGTGKVDKLEFRSGGQLRMSHTTQPWTAIWTFVEIVPNRKIVTRDIWPDGSGIEATGTLELIPKDGGCLLKLRHGPFPTKGPYMPEGAAAGSAMVADRLAEELETPGPGEGFRLVRYFNAPPSKVYQMWTTKEGLGKWWALGAKDIGYAFKVAKLDVRVGGEYDLVMSNKEQGELHNHGKYVEVVPNKRLVQEWQFDIFLGPGEKPYPISVTVEFEETPTMEPGKMGTKMTFTQGPMAKPDFTEGSRRGVMNNFSKLEKALDG